MIKLSHSKSNQSVYIFWMAIIKRSLGSWKGGWVGLGSAFQGRYALTRDPAISSPSFHVAGHPLISAVLNVKWAPFLPYLTIISFHKIFLVPSLELTHKVLLLHLFSMLPTQLMTTRMTTMMTMIMMMTMGPAMGNRMHPRRWVRNGGRSH